MSRNEYTIGDHKKHNRRQSHLGGPPGMRPGEKPKEFKKTWGKLMNYSKSYVPAIIIALLFSAIGTVFTIIGPSQLRKITDLITAGLITGIDINAIVTISTTLVILYGLSAVLTFSQGFIMATITQRISKSLRTSISKKINRLPLKYFDTNSYGDVLSRVTNDVDTIGQTMNQSLGTLVSAITLFFGSLFMMLITNVLMTVAAIFATIIGFVLMMIIMGKSQKHFMRQQEYLGAINGHIEEIYAGHNIVKVYNGEEKAKETFEKINNDLYESAFKSQFLSGLMMPIMTFIGNLGYVTVCVVGAALAMNGYITFGVIVAFMIYVRLFTQPLSQMAQAATNLQSTTAASERVFEFLEEKELEDESHKSEILTITQGNIEFRNVKFGYDEDKIIINGFSAKAKAGQKIAIVGPTGAGKTTIINLLMRFYETNEGEILIDGTPISQLTREKVHALFCMVLQDTWLFEGTIRENIVYSKPNVSNEALEKACKAVGIDHFIRTLPNGYDTVLNDKANLSQGQKQLITIARAMIENAPMLILDEATSSVDTRTELLIQEAMDKLTIGRTSFVIAHRLSTIKNADLILVMKDGDIIESGKHDDLLEHNGFYAELYNSQFEQAS
ncbi:ATP-binding cassette subfamily B protein [Natranaerovirga pectinivora]|uniref:ATP-binding cassette subfamily B protein n=1 Tax=Natranaerovirga pectinivora TaxID=682400 RepID=A0A4R3MMB6_9FIRM|nr:ABC transporter ATP-binding protein [Natranaerovirga pectinivora]TCT16075.1 ATP-binding cassette subfamily B protein [Natranaerovirga pectinivora]